MKTYTSKEILEAKDDLFSLQDSFVSMGIPFDYRMTNGEFLWWRDFVRGRYCIADWIEKRIRISEDESHWILRFSDHEEMIQALADDDGWPEAVMLSKDTALQELFYWLS